MRILYTKGFHKQASNLPKKIQDMLAVLVSILARDPFYPTLHTKKLKCDLQQMLSFRITRDWRVLFTIASDGVITLLDVGHRKDIYK